MEAEHSPQPGQLLGGKYRIVREIGRGAMGLVLEAQHVQTGKRVAVKWLHAHVMESRSAVERLMREAQASARVRHSNVVDVYDVEREGDALFLVMEYLEGEPLTNLMERGGVPVHELLSLIVQAMRGVSEAHRRGIVHRDIKPDNIFLAYEPDQRLPIVKVLDFGISKIDAPGGLSLTQTGSALGTPLYMSYEQLSGVRDVDARSDVYGFGVILYEALTGTLPYAADNFAELAAKVITTEPPRPRQIHPEIPEALEQVVLWAMKKRREERAPSLAVVIEALTPFTRPDQGHVSLSSARLPALPEVARVPVAPVSSEPAPPPSTPSLRLNEQTGWNDILTRSERERREAEQRVTSLVAGTMYEGRRKRGGGGGVWMAILGALGAVAVGIVLATVSRSGDVSKARDDKAAQAPVTSREPPAEDQAAERAVPPGKEPAPASAAPAEPAEELPEPAAPTQVEQVQKFDAVQPDAGVSAAAPAAPATPPAPATPRAAGQLPKNAPGGAARAAKPGPRPAYSAPSGESLPPPPIIEAAPVQQLPAVDPFPPVTSPTPPPPSAPAPAPEAPVAPVDVNPFEGDPEPGSDPYRAGKPREDEF